MSLVDDFDEMEVDLPTRIAIMEEAGAQLNMAIGLQQVQAWTEETDYSEKYRPMGPWAYGPMGPWAHGPLTPTT